MPTISASVRIEENLYKEAKEVFQEMGMPFSVGINIFLHYVVQERGMPFALRADNGQGNDQKR